MAESSMVNLGLVICSMWFILIISPCSSEHISRISDVGHHYPVHIGAEDHIVQGRVSSEAEPGDLVPSNVVLEGSDEADVKVHLRVEVRDSVYKRPHMYHPGNKQNESVIEEFLNSTLPFGMQFVVIHSNAFYVNEDRYLTVNDFSNLNGETRIHFDVILKDNLAAETKYVSNHLHFVVEIEYPKRDPNPNAVLFAGVLVLTIVIISLLIPFVVRAKRRCKAGKPIFGCGSADDASDIDSLGSLPEYLRKRANSIGGKSNLAMILDTGRMKHQRPSVDQHATIQDHMLRSTSGFQFKPHCMDPHYNDVYERPDYNNYKIQSSKTAATVNTNGSNLAPVGSTTSSENSDKTYPQNVSKHISKRGDNGVVEGSGKEKANAVTAKSGVALTHFDESQTAKGSVANVGSALSVLPNQVAALNSTKLKAASPSDAPAYPGCNSVTVEVGDVAYNKASNRDITLEKF